MSTQGPDELASSEPAVRAYLARRLHGSEVEDAAQTVMQRALERIDAYQSAARPRAWLLGVARNVVYEVVRARGRGPLEASEEPRRDPDVEPELSAEDRIDLIERNHQLYHALEALRLDDQLVLLMTYVDGIPGPEAAGLLGVSFAAFRQRLSRARRQAEQRLRSLAEAPARVDPRAMRAWQELLSADAEGAREGAWRAVERAKGRPRRLAPRGDS